MSLAVTCRNQPPTTIDDDLQAHMEARDIGEPGAEGEEAEEPESASDDDAQEDEDSDDFDEDADGSDAESGTKYDIVERYNFVWSECWMEGPTAYEGGSIIIRGSADQDQEDEPFKCTAAFKWRQFVGEFTCIYRPDTQTFTDFKAKRKTLDGGMEQLFHVKIHMWEETRSRETGTWVRKEIKDDRDHLFLFVQMDLGGWGTD